MDPHGAIAQRFPLVARARPACLPLPERVHALAGLADTAARQADPGIASTVYNQAALIASDLNMPELARELCHQHADAYLNACPLPGKSAIRGLEPVVNLARLHIRAGKTDEGRQLLLTLYTAVSTGMPVQLDDVAVPAHLTGTPEDRQEARAWLWRVLLADGTRALAVEGRWSEALTHITEHRGVGKRMLDGRQVAVLAALVTGASARAEALLEDTATGEPWEQAVTACLTALCRQPAADRPTRGLADIYAGLEPERGTAVFNARLGLSILDIIGSGQEPIARRVIDVLHRRATTLNDGYAARENLTHPLFTTLATNRQQEDCRDVVDVCALGAGHLPDELHNQLVEALRTSHRTIRECTTQAEPRVATA